MVKSPFPSLKSPGKSSRGKPRTMKQHIIRRLTMVLPLCVLSIIAAKSGILDRLADRYTFTDMSWFNDSALVQHVEGIITTNGMTTTRKDCLMPIVNGNTPPDATIIDIMEKHTKNCPNPDGSFPKLFSVKVDRVDRTISTDQGTPGVFHPLPR